MPLSDEDMYRIMGPTSMAPDEIGTLKSKEPEKTYYYWEKFYNLVCELKKKITTTPNIIISIGKGGSIPGVILAEHYNINNLNFGLKSYSGYNRNTIFEYQSIPDYESLRDANVLLIDDIADSGETLLYAVNKLRQNFCERFQTATVFYKTGSKFKPDYFAEEVPKDLWIVQPWEFIK